MRKLIYLFNNFHLNKISISFIVLSTILLMYSVKSSISIDLNNLEDLRNYDSLKHIFIFDIYNILEIIISMFVIILSFMELYNNSHLFDVVLIAKHKKVKVLVAKLISYIAIVVTYITIIFLLVIIIGVSEFQDIYLINDILVLYRYCLVIGIMTLLLSVILLTLFKNYFANFILLLFVIVKRVFLETNNNFIDKFLPFVDTKEVSVSISPTLIILYILGLIAICFTIYKFKDIKT